MIANYIYTTALIKMVSSSLQKSWACEHVFWADLSSSVDAQKIVLLGWIFGTLVPVMKQPTRNAYTKRRLMWSP